MASRRSGCGSPVGAPAPTPPPYVKLSLQRLQHPAEQRVNLALRKRLSWITERAPPRHPARSVRQPCPAILAQPVEPLQQRSTFAAQQRLEVCRRDSSRDDEREIPRDRGLRRERPINRSLARPHLDPLAAGCTSQPGAAAATANSKWRFRSHMSISGSFAASFPSPQNAGWRAPVSTMARWSSSVGRLDGGSDGRKTVPTSNNRTSRFP